MKNFLPIIYIILIVLAVIFCYYIGKIIIDPITLVSSMHWIMKPVIVFLGAMVCTGSVLITIIMIAGYEKFKQFLT